MGKRSVKLRLLDIRLHIQGIMTNVAGMDAAQFGASSMHRLAIERGFEIISEASRHVPDELKASTPHVPWRRLADLGNVLRHAYERVEPDRLWMMIETDLPILATVIEEAIAVTPDD